MDTDRNHEDDEDSKDPRRYLPPEHEITAMFEMILARFAREHEMHTRPYGYGEGTTSRANGACRHLRDQIVGSPLTHITSIEAHLWSNAPGVRLCLACSRQAFHGPERLMCATCCQPNPYTDGHYRIKDRACAINSIYEPPLTLHIPLCRRCERVIARYRASTAILRNAV